MNISITITDSEAAALARRCQVLDYKDGNELIQKCADAATSTVKKQALIAAIALSPSKAVIDATVTAWEATTGTELKLATAPKVAVAGDAVLGKEVTG